MEKISEAASFFSVSVVFAAVILQAHVIFPGSERLPSLVVAGTFFIFIWLLGAYRCIRVKKDLIYFLLLVAMYILIVAFFRMVASQENAIRHDLVTASHFAIFIFLGKFFLDRLGKKNTLALARFSIYLSLLWVFIETYVRLRYPADAPSLLTIDGFRKILSPAFYASNGFYPYKHPSIMFIDSNYVGAYLVFTLALIITLHHYTSEMKEKVSIVLSMILILLSFSRSAWLAALGLLVLQLFFFSNTSRGIRGLFLILVLVGVAPFIINIWTYITQDGSWDTKVEILRNLYFAFFSSELPEILFGFGLVDGGYKFSYQEGKYAHLLLALLLGQIGLFGSLFYLLLWFYLLHGSGRYSLLALGALIVPGVSLQNPYQVYYILVALLITSIGKTRKCDGRCEEKPRISAH